MKKNNEEYYHDKGEQDRSKKEEDNKVGHFKLPHGIIDDLTTWSRDKMEQNRRENEAYKKGWGNTDDQIKGKK
jgi:hypothetical protein